MKKLMIFLSSLTFVCNSFGMLIRTSFTKKITSQQRMQNFHTALPTRSIDPLDICVIALLASNLYDIHKLQNEIQDLKTKFEQTEEQNKSMLKTLKQNAHNNIKAHE